MAVVPKGGWGETTIPCWSLTSICSPHPHKLLTRIYSLSMNHVKGSFKTNLPKPSTKDIVDPMLVLYDNSGGYSFCICLHFAFWVCPPYISSIPSCLSDSYLSWFPLLFLSTLLLHPLLTLKSTHSSPCLPLSRPNLNSGIFSIPNSSSLTPRVSSFSLSAAIIKERVSLP